MKQIAKPHTENDCYPITITGNEEMYKAENIFLLFEVLWQLNWVNTVCFKTGFGEIIGVIFGLEGEKNKINSD